MFISLTAGSIPAGGQLSVRNRRTGAEATVVLIDGGFDPLPFPATVGDTLDVSLTQVGSADVLRDIFLVPEFRPPVVVRTDPRPGRRDVPLNAVLFMVFSEPIDVTTLNATSVRLSQGGVQVGGSLAFEDALHLTATFTPATPLAAGTSYRLTVTEAIEDLGGESLQAPVVVDFVTTSQGLPTGTVKITTTTAGTSIDPDGYSVSVSNDPIPVEMALPTAGTVVVNVPAGLHSIWLRGVAANCSLLYVPGFSRQVNVVAGSTVTVPFDVTCGSAPPSGLAFVRDGRIYRIDGDGGGLVQLTDGPVDAVPVWSPDGQRLAFTRQSASVPWWSDLYVMDADGSNVVQLTQSGTAGQPTWSPDGRRIAFEYFPGTGSIDIYVLDLTLPGSAPTPIVTGPGYDGQPSWSPDGNTIAFVSDRVLYDFTLDIFLTTPDGSTLTQLTNGIDSESSIVLYTRPGWSPDGQRLAIALCRPITDSTCDATEILVMNADGSGLRSLTLASSGDGTGPVGGPTWSPDGALIAYRSRQLSIDWRSVDGVSQGVLVENGHSPAWRP